MSHLRKMLVAVRITKILTLVAMCLVAVGMVVVMAFMINDLSNYDPGLSYGEVTLEQYHAREIVTMADGHRIVDKPGYWYIRIQQDGKWREVRLHEWQTMHVKVGDYVVVGGDYDIDVF